MEKMKWILKKINVFGRETRADMKMIKKSYVKLLAKNENYFIWLFQISVEFLFNWINIF